MKTCPVCHAVAFDDASTCFGCMHRFETRPLETGGLEFPCEKTPLAGTDCDGGTSVIGKPLAFLVSLTPVQREGATTWTCSIETAAV